MSAGSGASLTVDDIRDAVRLTNWLHSMPSTPLPQRRRHFLSGLCRLVSAEIGIAASYMKKGNYRLAPVVPSKKAGVAGLQDAVVSVGLDAAPAKRSLAETHFATKETPHPLVSPLLKVASRQPSRLLTCLREDLIDDATWSASDEVAALCQKLGVEDCLVSMYPVAQTGQLAWLFLFRKPLADSSASDTRFNVRDRELLHAIHAEMDWLYQQANLSTSASSATQPLETQMLTTRQKQTLDHLLAGNSEKQAAASMGLSPHTVHIHIKSLYRTFNVNTRQELLAKFIGRYGS